MITNKKAKDQSEKSLQAAVHLLLSEPSSVRTTKSGKRLQILSPGRKNDFEGPDFIDVALLLDGMVIVGDAEFHKKSSDWKHHNHSADKRYNNVILHIVIQDDSELQCNFETLQLNSDEITPLLEVKESKTDYEANIFNIEELQHYALLRLLRKTSEAQKIINLHGLDNALRVILIEYIDKYNSRKKRPVYTKEELAQLVDFINLSPLAKFLEELNSGITIEIPDRMVTLLKSKLLEEGVHLRREILLNCLLPLSLCIANEEARINLFLWFWSTPALNKYGILSRKFTNLPQNFLWQQQGMLEYIREHGRKPNVTPDAITNYGFSEVLSFYQLGNSPYKSKMEEN